MLERNNKGQFIKGNFPFDRSGIKHTEETKKKLRKARKGRTPNKPKEMLNMKFGRWTVIKFACKKHKQYAWLCRCDCGIERVVSGSILRNGRSKSCGCLCKELIAKRNRENCGEKSPTFGKKGIWAGKKRITHSEKMTGKGNPNWKGGITPENDKIRHSTKMDLWREAVFIRDSFICQKTKIKGGVLRAHHIQNFAQFPELRFEVSNGITLSKKAHQKFHRIYGIKNNTKEQIMKYLNDKSITRKFTERNH